MQGLFLPGKDFCSQVKSHANIKKITLTNFRISITVQAQMKIKMRLNEDIYTFPYTNSNF